MATTDKPAPCVATCGIPSTWDIIPAFPLWEVGSVIGKEGSAIRASQPGRSLLLASHRPKAQWVPTQGPRPAGGHRGLMPVLKPQEDGRTRLAIRAHHWSTPFARSVPTRPIFVADLSELGLSLQADLLGRRRRRAEIPRRGRAASSDHRALAPRDQGG
jgi:hypothetical protein